MSSNFFCVFVNFFRTNNLHGVVKGGRNNFLAALDRVSGKRDDAQPSSVSCEGRTAMDIPVIFSLNINNDMYSSMVQTYTHDTRTS